MVLELVAAAWRTWRRPESENRVPMVVAGVGVTITAPDRAASPETGHGSCGFPSFPNNVTSSVA